MWVVLWLAAGCSGSGDPVDAGAPSDGGVTEDAGSQGDAGSSPDAGDPDGAVGDGVSWKRERLGDLEVDTWTWVDAAGRPRTVSFKREGDGNPGHGGVAVRLTWQVPDGAGWRTESADGLGGGEEGFGMFVAHEHGRTFDDGSSGTIAGLHGEDDSPLGIGFPVGIRRGSLSATSTSGFEAFTSTYPKWGTVAPMADVDGQTPRSEAAHRRFLLPVTTRWHFAKGFNAPRIDVEVDLAQVTAGQLAFDVRGPYGVLEFANADANAPLNNVQWGDSAYHFTTLAPAAGNLTTAAGWTWDEPMGSTRPYHALLARSGTVLYELGLVETEPALVYSGWSGNRGTSSAKSGHRLLSDDFADWEWPFQSAQYSGVSANAPTTFKKFAWGSSNLYGSTATTQWLNDERSVSLVATPPVLRYRTCLIFGRSTFNDATRRGLTRTAAEAASLPCPTDP